MMERAILRDDYGRKLELFFFQICNQYNFKIKSCFLNFNYVG